MECGSSSKSFFSCFKWNRDGFFHAWRVLAKRLGLGRWAGHCFIYEAVSERVLDVKGFDKISEIMIIFLTIFLRATK